MQSTSVTLCPWHISFYPIPFPRLLPSHNLHLLTGRKFTTSTFSTVKTQIHFTSSCSFAIAATNSRSKDQRIKKKKKKKKTVSYPNQNRALSDELYAPIDSRSASSATTQIQELRRKEPVRNTEAEVKKGYVILTNMLWADLKAALGQRINLEGIVCSVGVFTRDRHLAIPHVAVPDIRYIDWAELKRRGFRGVVFDKDNTITVPYSLTLWAPLESSLERCKSEFGNNIAVFSNSAGLYEFDPDGRKARLLETAIGIKVVRHRVKKPGGTAEEIERQFDCESSRLIMVGDRPFTDIVYGNRNGFLTILTQPLSLAEEPFIVKQVRKLEVAIINRWCRKGLKPANHGLLPDAQGCLNNYPIPPPPL